MIAETYTKISADKKPALRGLFHTVFLSRFFRLCILTNRNHHQLNSRRRHTRNTAGLRQCFRTYILQFQRDFTRQTWHDVIIEVAWNTGFFKTFHLCHIFMLTGAISRNQVIPFPEYLDKMICDKVIDKNTKLKLK